ncbi:MAG: cupin domain-containing protein [Candidatus Latescibacterota bacterium]
MGNRIAFAAVFLVLASVAGAQEEWPYYELDPKPYNPAVDVNTDMFMADWRDSSPRLEHGTLIVRDILTRHDGEDPLKPKNRGAVLNVLTEYAHATLPSRSVTAPAKLVGAQKIFYFLAGTGAVTAGGKTSSVYSYVAVLIPEGLEFTIKNTGDSDLTMIIVGEPTWPGFQPRKDMLTRDENALPISGVTGHWVNINKQVFTKADGLSAIIGFSPVWLDPITMAQPHASKGLGTDVLWLALEGDIYTLFGKKLYHLKPGMAFKNPSDGKVYHSNINMTGKQIKLLWVRSVAPENFPGK